MTVAGAIATVLERPLVVADPFEPLDAIVVLGAPLLPSGRISTILIERVAAAADLYRRGGGPIVVATGGVTLGAPRAEADVLADSLRSAGIPEVVVENKSLTTAQNARFTAELLFPRDARRIWIVTQPFHGRRAARLFRSAGFEPKVWHIADSIEYQQRRRALRWLVREYASWGALFVRGGR